MLEHCQGAAGTGLGPSGMWPLHYLQLNWDSRLLLPQQSMLPPAQHNRDSIMLAASTTIADAA
jgi:hypothetical protein